MQVHAEVWAQLEMHEHSGRQMSLAPAFAGRWAPGTSEGGTPTTANYKSFVQSTHRTDDVWVVLHSSLLLYEGHHRMNDARAGIYCALNCRAAG